MQHLDAGCSWGTPMKAGYVGRALRQTIECCAFADMVSPYRARSCVNATSDYKVAFNVQSVLHLGTAIVALCLAGYALHHQVAAPCRLLMSMLKPLHHSGSMEGH